MGFLSLHSQDLLHFLFMFSVSLAVRSCTFPRHDLFIELNRLSNLVFHPSHSHLGLEVCMKNVLVTLKIYLREKFNYSLSHPDPDNLFYILTSKRSWVIELSNVGMIFELGWISDHLGVFYKNIDPQRIPKYNQDIFVS